MIPRRVVNAVLAALLVADVFMVAAASAPASPPVVPSVFSCPPGQSLEFAPGSPLECAR